MMKEVKIESIDALSSHFNFAMSIDLSRLPHPIKISNQYRQKINPQK